MNYSGCTRMSPSQDAFGSIDDHWMAGRGTGQAGVDGALRRNRAFANWSDSAIRGLGSRCRVIWLPRGERLRRDGMHNASSYLVQSGWLLLQACARQANDRNAVALLGEGMMVCSLMPDRSLLGAFDALAQRDTALIEVPSDALHRQLDESPHLWADLTLALLAQDDALFDAVVGQVTGSVSQRVARTLLQYVRLCSVKVDDTNVVKLKMSQDELGTLLQLSRKTVGRELRVLEGKGLVRRCYNHIQVPDVDALEHHAEHGSAR